MSELIYQVDFLTEDKYKLFRGVYADFVHKAISDYRFELAPLTYDEFIDAVESKAINCIILSENNIPTAFLVYVTAISESVELNVIHCLGDEDLVNKRNALTSFFMEKTKSIRNNTVVCYPMLGTQADYAPDITHYGFKLIGLVVLRFLMNDSISNMILSKVDIPTFGNRYKLVHWDQKYFDQVVDVIYETFKTTSDALFDTRFTSLEGTRDILEKIVDNIYGDFLPEATTLLLCENNVVGVAMANVTGGKIANIPLVGLLKEHRGTGLSVAMLNRVMNTILESCKHKFTEVNVTTETDNSGALNMYRTVGFREDYSYVQAYLPR